MSDRTDLEARVTAALARLRGPATAATPADRTDTPSDDTRAVWRDPRRTGAPSRSRTATPTPAAPSFGRGAAPADMRRWEGLYCTATLHTGETIRGLVFTVELRRSGLMRVTLRRTDRPADEYVSPENCRDFSDNP